MKIHEKTIDYLKDIITGNAEKTPYKSGPQLVKYFNQFGFNDEYNRGEGFPSRWRYCKDKLEILNQEDRIEEVLEDYYTPINFIENEKQYINLITELNKYLAFNDLKLRIKGKICKVIEDEQQNIISEATYSDNIINITLKKEVFEHVKDLLNGGNFYNAVEEAYKIVRQKLKSITGQEKADDAFAKKNYTKLFGHAPKDQNEENYFMGVQYLHKTIQFLRNEKAHTPAKEIDKNLAIHYIVLASLAYDLINSPSPSEEDKIREEVREEMHEEYLEEQAEMAWEEQMIKDKEIE